MTESDKYSDSYSKNLTHAMVNLFYFTTAYLPTQNFLINAVGIHDATPALTGCAIAGTSTSIGFLAAQTTLNAIYPDGKLWNDGK